MRYKTYAWTIDKDVLFAQGETETNEAGTTGPSNAAPGLIEALKNKVDGVGRRFRLKDDDGELYYEGRILTVHPAGTSQDFSPLDDFGMPNAGCTVIEYLENGEWKVL